MKTDNYLRNLHSIDIDIMRMRLRPKTSTQGIQNIKKDKKDGEDMK